MFVKREGLQVARVLLDFIEQEALPGTEIDSGAFWRGFSMLVERLAPVNRELLAERDRLQTLIDGWHKEHRGKPFDIMAYEKFLTEIGYLLPEGRDFSITMDETDPEVSKLAGPQLVVPLSNARFALNAANARWGSLYDALYGTDVIPQTGELAPGKHYNPVRGEKVIAFARDFLDEVVPLSDASHRDVAAYCVANCTLRVTLKDGSETGLAKPECFAGFIGEPGTPSSILLAHHGLHIEIVIDRSSPVGQTDSAGVRDVVLEAALTTIMDCEDSIAAVDAEDKTATYRNWLGLMRGTLSARFEKDGRMVDRTLHPDRHFNGADGTSLELPGRSLLFIRNVGHLMTSDAVLLRDGSEIPEGILDGVITSLIAVHDRKSVV